MKQKDSEVEQVKADLDIEEHLSMQEKGWRIQLFGLCGIFGLMLTAAIGLYGDGFVSKKTIDQNEIKVEYQRFFRFEAKMEIRINATSTKEIQVSFPPTYLNSFEITSIVPAQKTNYVKDGRIEYVFPGGDPAEIVFHLIPKDFGRIEGPMFVNDNQFFITHFIFP